MVTVDLSNLDHIVVSQPIAVSTQGLEKLTSQRPEVSNIDIAFGPDRKRIYAVGDVKIAIKEYPAFITSRLVVLSMDSQEFAKGTGAWRVESVIGPELTGFPRNHNAGLVRDADGDLPEGKLLTVVFARSCAFGSNFPCEARAEWTYNLWEISSQLPTSQQLKSDRTH